MYVYTCLNIQEKTGSHKLTWHNDDIIHQI